MVSIFYNEIKGDITVNNPNPIAHCISIDCAMGAGVVVPICRMHPKLKMFCRQYRDTHTDLATGTTLRYSDNQGVVYNMFTKQIVKHHAGFGMTKEDYLNNLKNCLLSVKTQMLENNETTLTMPKIGCGLDRCDWNTVCEMIYSVFADTDIAIIVFYL